MNIHAQLVQKNSELESLRAFIADMSAHHQRVVKKHYAFIIALLLCFVVIALIARVEFSWV